MTKRERNAAYHAEHRDAIRARQREYHVTRYARDKEALKAYQRKYRAAGGLREVRTGWSQEDYNAAFAAQNGCCAICGRHASEFKNALNADHCHRSGAKRKLLCSTCNFGLGQFKDDADLLRRAATYLDEFDSVAPAPSEQ